MLILISSSAPCESSEYRCPEGICISFDHLCDEYPNDCLDNVDESDELCLGRLKELKNVFNFSFLLLIS